MDSTTKKKGFELAGWLRLIGFTLLGLTGFLVWREVSLDAVFLLLAASATSMAISLWLERTKRPVVGPLLSLVSTLVSAGWYAATREPTALVALLLAFATLGILSWRHRARDGSLHRAFSLVGAAFAGLAASLATSFHLFHASELGDENFIARRVILTIGWLVPGLWALTRGSRREDGAQVATGVMLTVASLGKLVVYDTVALDGALRIAAYGVAGLLTLAAGQLLTRKAGGVEARS